MKNSFRAGILLLASLAVFCGGKVTYDLATPGILLETGNFTVPTKVFVSMFDVMRRSRLKEAKDPRAAIFMIVADNYLAENYLKTKDGKIEPAIAAEIDKVYHETLVYYINDKDPQKLFKVWVKKITLPQTAQLKALFDEKAEAAYTNVPLKRAEAEKVILATYGEKGEKTLNYAALFDAQPQAGKLHLFTSPNRQSLEEMVTAYLRRELLDDFAAKAGPTEKAEYAALKRLVENSILSRHLRYEMGMENANPHAENSAVKNRAKSVSLSRIKEYYEANKENYKEVQTIDCRHIQLKNYDLAVNLRDQIDAGANMVELVKKHSLAADKNAADPGMIRGIKNDTELHKRPRIETLCMMPKQGESDVVRDGDFYHVVKAEKRTDGYPPLDETTHLKEDLAREIAAKDLKAEFDARKKKILGRVDIRINKTELEKIR